MANPATLLTLLENGSDVTLFTAMPPDKIFELAEAAHKSGAKLTIPAAISPEFLVRLSTKYGKTVAFMNGLDDFKKE
jgi:hypothetical protein